MNNYCSSLSSFRHMSNLPFALSKLFLALTNLSFTIIPCLPFQSECLELVFKMRGNHKTKETIRKLNRGEKLVVSSFFLSPFLFLSSLLLFLFLSSRSQTKFLPTYCCTFCVFPNKGKRIHERGSERSERKKERGILVSLCSKRRKEKDEEKKKEPTPSKNLTWKGNKNSTTQSNNLSSSPQPYLGTDDHPSFPFPTFLFHFSPKPVRE